MDKFEALATISVFVIGLVFAAFGLNLLGIHWNRILGAALCAIGILLMFVAIAGMIESARSSK